MAAIMARKRVWLPTRASPIITEAGPAMIIPMPMPMSAKPWYWNIINAPKKGPVYAGGKQ